MKTCLNRAERENLSRFSDNENYCFLEFQKGGLCRMGMGTG